MPRRSYANPGRNVKERTLRDADVLDGEIVRNYPLRQTVNLTLFGSGS